MPNKNSNGRINNGSLILEEWIHPTVDPAFLFVINPTVEFNQWNSPSLFL
jgi:hypothetical protein